MRNAITVLLGVTALGWVVAAGVAVSANGNGSDIVRQWIVCQYLKSGSNPYELSKDILLAKYEAGNPGRVKVYAIPKEIPALRVNGLSPELGPPEATYPPPAVGLLACTIGHLTDPRTVLWIWFAINLAAVSGVVIGLTRLCPVPPGDGTVADNTRLVLAALLLFPATYSTLMSGQFSLLVLGLVLAATDPSLPWLPRGMVLGLALVKPSVALPFFLLSLVRREWCVMAAAAAVQAAAGAYVAGQTGATFSLFKDWLTISGFFLQGMYTFQDWLNVAGPRIPWLVPAASLGILILCGVTLTAARRLPRARQLSIAAVTSVFWTYHGSYDFVVLLPALLPLAGWSDQPQGRRWSPIGIAVFAILAFGLSPMVYGGTDLATRIIRWSTRLVVIGLFLREYLLAWTSVFRLDCTEHQAAEGDSAAVNVLRDSAPALG
ncbi:MAG TPA: glycosyltransferase family 87 protein [Gemmataceae bacterium]|nr:glycosyltransferase family 87 protein [Gemmataceae bacterium]